MVLTSEPGFKESQVPTPNRPIKDINNEEKNGWSISVATQGRGTNKEIQESPKSIFRSLRFGFK